MASLRVATWNIAGARREQTNQVDLDAVAAGVQALGVDLLAMQEVDRQLARSGRSDQPAVIAQALGAGLFWSFAPALVGSCLLTLDALSIQTAPDGYRRIVWMIIGMIKAHPTENRMARRARESRLTQASEPSGAMSTAS